MPGWRVFNSFTTRFTLTVLLLLAVPLLAITAGTATMARHALEDNAVASLASVQRNVAEKLERFLWEREGDAQVLSRMFWLRERDMFTNAKETRWLQGFRDVYSRAYDWIGVTDPHGVIRLATDPRGLGKDIRRTDWFRQGSKHLYIGRMAPDPILGGQPAFGYAIPLHDMNGHFAGVVTTRIKLTTLQDIVANGWVDGQGQTFIAVPQSGAILTRYAYQPSPEARQFEHWYQTRHGEPYIGTDHEQEIVVASPMIRDGKLLEDYPWEVVTMMPEATAMAPARAMARTIWLLAAIGLGIGAVVAVGISRRIVAPISHLALAADQIADGHQNVHVPESGPDEFARLAKAFNTMAERVESSIETLRQANAELRKVDELKNNFVSTVSHELRTPLASIMAYGEFLEDQVVGPLTQEQLGYVRQVLEGARRLEVLVDDLLDFARIESGTLTLAVRDADVAELVGDAVEVVRPHANTGQIALSAELGDQPLTAVIDSRRISQVILNLLGNAIKFTKPGGRVVVRACREGTTVKVTVEDTGIGIPADKLPRLFNKFYQVDPRLTREFGGAGLGLAISKALVEAHSGTMGVTSEPGHGSTFWFSLPASDAPETQVA
ncbi:MAG: HAMP domain-containing protein [Cyanobacteria bacterium REEB65]|nr:HAMP domain-containing protein [Cyanobacteria bacterium REEB65]